MIRGAHQLQWDVACFGELVMDFVPHSQCDGMWLYAPNPGGAPGNVAAGLARLGRRAVMLGKLGKDSFGNTITAALLRFGVDVSGVAVDASVKTAVSMVTLGQAGEREFTFYRDTPAELAIDLDDTMSACIEASSILHLGTLPFSAPRSAAAQRRAIELAKSAGRMISVDPNFRPALWTDRDAMVLSGRELISVANIVKLSEDELLSMSDGSSIEHAVRSHWHDELKIMAVTKGANGAQLFTRMASFVCKGYAVEAIDTTAAGDSFTATLLSGVLDLDVGGATPTQLVHVLRNACAAGALATTRRGAMASLPGIDDIARLLQR